MHKVKRSSINNRFASRPCRYAVSVFNRVLITIWISAAMLAQVPGLPQTDQPRPGQLTPFATGQSAHIDHARLLNMAILLPIAFRRIDDPATVVGTMTPEGSIHARLGRH